VVNYVFLAMGRTALGVFSFPSLLSPYPLAHHIPHVYIPHTTYTAYHMPHYNMSHNAFSQKARKGLTIFSRRLGD